MDKALASLKSHLPQFQNMCTSTIPDEFKKRKLPMDLSRVVKNVANLQNRMDALSTMLKAVLSMAALQVEVTSMPYEQAAHELLDWQASKQATKTGKKPYLLHIIEYCHAKECISGKPAPKFVGGAYTPYMELATECDAFTDQFKEFLCHSPWAKDLQMVHCESTLQ